MPVPPAGTPPPSDNRNGSPPIGTTDGIQLGVALLLASQTARPPVQFTGDRHRLQEQLATMLLAELQALAEQWPSFFSVQLNCEQMLLQLQQVRRQAVSNDRINVLIALGAPYAMMAGVCKLSWQEYIDRGGISQPGRPRLPTEAEIQQITRALEEIGIQPVSHGGGGGRIPPLNISQWLAFARLTRGLSLRISWSFLRAGQ